MPLWALLCEEERPSNTQGPSPVQPWLLQLPQVRGWWWGGGQSGQGMPPVQATMRAHPHWEPTAIWGCQREEGEVLSRGEGGGEVVGAPLSDISALPQGRSHNCPCLPAAGWNRVPPAATKRLGQRSL